jgi:hypothetical protein
MHVPVATKEHGKNRVTQTVQVGALYSGREFNDSASSDSSFVAAE